MRLDGSNAENKIALLVILCIIMYVKKKNNNSKPISFFFTKPIMVKCLNIEKNIGQPIYRSISNIYIKLKIRFQLVAKAKILLLTDVLK